ncbi:two-component response regulator [Escherichia coli]|nr:two-component response regulator [Escherichia coli]
MTNVLIVEDEQAIRRFLRTALEGDGMRVFEAETLQRGLLEAATRKPDLIILDLGLPDGDGIEFIRDLRQWSAVPVIVLSARSEESDKIAALDAGADDYLSKPFGIGRIAGPSARRITPPLCHHRARSAGKIFRCYRRFSRPRDSPG